MLKHATPEKEKNCTIFTFFALQVNQDKYVSKLLNYIYLTFHSNQNLVKSSVGEYKANQDMIFVLKRLHYNNRGRNRKHPALKLGILEKQIKDAKSFMLSLKL